MYDRPVITEQETVILDTGAKAPLHLWKNCPEGTFALKHKDVHGELPTWAEINAALFEETLPEVWESDFHLHPPAA